ncbi:MAG: hypothetical protein IJW40_07290 [Clostridia bacterium]|nr:hypothetical protein [Clostridia bacterium]
MEQKPFHYRYCAAQTREVENIRKKYIIEEKSKLEQLKALDARVQSAGMLQGLTVGIVGCLIFGIGMCFGLDVLHGPDYLSILFGLLGVCVMIPAYPIARRIATRTKKQLTPQILQLSDDILRQEREKSDV